MFNRLSRAITAGVVTLSMLAGCTTPSTQLAASSVHEWVIKPVVRPAAKADKTTSQQPVLSNPGNASAVDMVKAETQIEARPNPQPGQIMATHTEIAQATDVGVPTDTSANKVQTGAGGDFVSSQVSSVATRGIESFLGQFGTAKISPQGLTGDTKFGGSVDLLVPVIDNEKEVAFGQLGLRHTNAYTESYRTTVNWGVGYRRFFDDRYMIGGNVFFDQDITRDHQRLGVGAEFWMDNLKLSANAYHRLSGWRISPDLANYVERPATGWDVRAEGFLPSYPQLGGKIVYEQYYGDEVALFGVEERSSNPKALTLGLSYTPVPAISLGVDHRMGQGTNSTGVTLDFKYALGVPLAKQFRASDVAPSRKLEAMRLDLVDRNNEIVLEYAKDNRGGIKLPTQVANYPGAVIQFPVNIAFAQTGAVVEWTGSAAAFAAPYDGSGIGSLTLPAYNHGGNNTYQLAASTIDNHGRALQSNTMTVTVQPITILVAASKPTALADGKESVTFTATLTGVQGEILQDHSVRWVVPSEVTVANKEEVTDTRGEAATVIHSKKAFQARVSATDVYGFESEASTIFRGDKTTAMVTSLIANPSQLLANGADVAAMVATVQDVNGNPVGAGVTVNWTTDNGTLLGSSSVTGQDSTATVDLRSTTTPGAANVSARTTIAGDPGASVRVPFVVDLSGAVVVTLSADKTYALADGADSVNLTATVQDAFGNLVGAGATVNWITSLGVLGSSSTITGPDSKTTVRLTAPSAAGQAIVGATASTVDPGKTQAIDFAHAIVVSLVPSKTQAEVNESVGLTATVRDTLGNSVGAGVSVLWSTNLGSLSAASTVTNAAGIATNTLVSTGSTGTATVGSMTNANDTPVTAQLQILRPMTCRYETNNGDHHDIRTGVYHAYSKNDANPARPKFYVDGREVAEAGYSIGTRRYYNEAMQEADTSVVATYEICSRQ